jgi:hypothetical protein
VLDSTVIHDFPVNDKVKLVVVVDTRFHRDFSNGVVLSRLINATDRWTRALFTVQYPGSSHPVRCGGCEVEVKVTCDPGQACVVSVHDVPTSRV